MPGGHQERLLQPNVRQLIGHLADGAHVYMLLTAWCQGKFLKCTTHLGVCHNNPPTYRLCHNQATQVSACVSLLLYQIAFFIFGLCYGTSTFLTAASVYISAYKTVPKGECQTLVKLCAWVSSAQGLPAQWTSAQLQ